MLPRLKETNKTRDMLQEFKGINKNVRASDGEFYEMQNMTSDYYPALSPRNPRGIGMKLKDCGGLLAKDKLCYIEGDTLHYGDVTVPLFANLGKARQLVSFGAYIIVFPDQIYLNTADPSDRGQIIGHESYTYPTGENTVDFELVNKEGKSIPIMYVKGCNWKSSDSHLVGESKKENGQTLQKNKISYLGAEWTTESRNLDTTQTWFGSAIIDYVEAQKLKYNANYSSGKPKSTYLLFSLSCSGTANEFTLYDGGGGNGLHSITQGFENVEPFGGIDIYHYKIKATVESTEINQLKVGGYYSYGDLYYYIEVKGVDHPKVNEYLLDCTESPAKVKIYTENGWKDVETYVKITTSGIGEHYSGSGAGLKIVGFDSLENVYLKTGMFASLVDKYSANYGQLKEISTNSVMLPGVLSTGYTKISKVSGIDLEFQNLNLTFDYVVESQNRLWACRYGTDLTGQKVNKIYASALGDFKTWDKFDGTDDDSYFVNLGSDGEFTGAVNYNGNPIFFKENCIHRVYGNYPSAYNVTTDNSFGLQKGSAESLQVISGRLFYKATDGIYAYDGGSNSLVSLKLGLSRYKDAIGGNIDNKYYVSMVSDEDGKRLLYVYDILKDMWHVEDGLDVTHMEKYNDNLYIASRDGTVFTVKDKQGDSDEIVEWSAETGIIGYTMPDSKYVSCVQIRMSVSFGAEVQIYIEYDSDEAWEFKGAVKGSNTLGSYTFPIQPRRCDHFRIRLKGNGKCKIFSLTKIMENGGII